MPFGPTICRRALLFGLATLPLVATARPTHRAPALLLAHDAPPDVDPAGFLVSEKLDGIRAYWDGQKLWFRSGLPIPAPAWFVDRLPPHPLDGELWLGRARFEQVSGVVRSRVPTDQAWRGIRYVVFEWPGAAGTYEARVRQLQRSVERSDVPQLVVAEQSVVLGRSALQARLEAVVAAGGEGLMLHRADALYVTGRSAALLKLKPLHDAEAVVVGHVLGKGRHEGRLGALHVRTASGSSFHLGTGLSDAERESPPPLGSIVTFRYRGLTGTGVPRFASFLRRFSS